MWVLYVYLHRDMYVYIHEPVSIPTYHISKSTSISHHLQVHSHTFISFQWRSETGYQASTYQNIYHCHIYGKNMMWIWMNELQQISTVLSLSWRLLFWARQKLLENASKKTF